jgi:hypothetical protein
MNIVKLDNDKCPYCDDIFIDGKIDNKDVTNHMDNNHDDRFMRDYYI